MRADPIWLLKNHEYEKKALGLGEDDVVKIPEINFYGYMSRKLHFYCHIPKVAECIMLLN